MSAAPARVIYLDHAATTPVDPRVAAAMIACLGADGEFGNASSATHGYGLRAAAIVARAQAQVAALIGAAAADIVFTSGATEAGNLAILGAARAAVADGRRHVVTSRTEHKAVLDPCRRLEKEGFAVTWLAPEADGRVTPEQVRAALRADTALVSLMHVNNETGVVQDIAAIGAVCRERGALFHTDAAQGVGRLAFDVAALPVDLLSFTAHKLYGPKGIGALWVHPDARARLQPLLYGGGQQRGLRPGTVPTHQVAGFGVACELAAAYLATEPARQRALTERLWRGIAGLDGVLRNGAAELCVPGLLNVSFAGLDGESLVTGLAELAVATGSACNSANGEPSYVLRAMGRSPVLAQGSLRLSLGRGTTEADVDRAATAIVREVRRLRAASPAGPGDSGEGAIGWAMARAATAGSGAEASSPAVATMPPLDRPLDGLLGRLVPAAREAFLALPGAGAFPPGTPGVVTGEAGGTGHDAWIRLHLQLRDGRVTAARFQVLGCPHTLAVAAAVAARAVGRPADDPVPGPPAAWAAEFGVPVEKLGRLLLVEDALTACVSRLVPRP